MKKLKLLIPILPITLIGAIAPIATSCSKILKISIQGQETLYWQSNNTYEALADYDSGKQKVTKKVTWSIVSDPQQTGASISDQGVLTAPNKKSGQIVIQVVLTKDETIKTTMTVSIVSPAKSIKINPIEDNKIFYGREIQFSAKLDIEEGYESGIKWRIVEDESQTGSTISDTGVFTAGFKTGPVTIEAKSIYDESIKDEYEFKVITNFESLTVNSYNTFVPGASAISLVDFVTISTIDGTDTGYKYDNFKKGDTEATYDAATKTFTPGSKEGVASIDVIADTDPLNPITIKFLIGTNFTQYEISGGTALVKSFNADVINPDPSVTIIADEYEGKPVTKISEYAFSYAKLTNINIPDSIIEIGDGAFSGSKIKEISFGQNCLLEKIGSFAFAGTKLTSLTLPKNVKTINEMAFEHCDNLVSCDLSAITNNVTWGGNCIFGTCTSLETLILPNNITIIPLAFCMSCEKLNNIVIPKSVTTIDDYAFVDCKSLNNITFKGTIDEWQKINKVGNWHKSCPAKSVYCEESKEFCDIDA